MRPAAALGIALALASIVALASASFGLYVAPRSAVAAWLALALGSSVVLALAGALLARARLDERRVRAAVLLGALALRLGALAAPVSLSDDVYRYVWDGALLASGHDPYASRPVDVADLPGLGELERLNSPRYYTVYPPLAQASFAASVLVARPIGLEPTFALRVLFVLAELSALWALLALARRLAIAPAWVLVYAWHPLVYWEVAAGGHTEALMLLPLALAIAAALDDRPARAGVLLGLAAGAKLTALVVLPVLAVHLARKLGARASILFALAALLLPLALFLPFASATLMPNIAESLALYQATFSFNAPVYYGLRHLFGYREGLTASVDPVVGPILGVATLAVLAVLSARQDGSARRLVVGLAYTYVGYLLLSRVVHPWYLLPALALGVLAESRAIAVLALLSLLSYFRYDPLGYESALVLAVQLAAFVALAARELRAPH